MASQKGVFSTGARESEVVYLGWFFNFTYSIADDGEPCLDTIPFVEGVTAIGW